MLKKLENSKFVRHIIFYIFDSIQLDFELLRNKFASLTVINCNIIKIYDKNKKIKRKKNLVIFIQELSCLNFA